MNLKKLIAATALTGALASPVYAHTDCEGIEQLHLTANESCPEPVLPAASSSPLAAGGLTAGTAVIGAVTLAVVIAAVVDDGNTPETTTTPTTK